MLVQMGQDLNAFIKSIVNDQSRGQYNSAELQLLLNQSKKEVGARLQQVEELKEAYSALKKDVELKDEQILALEKRIQVAQDDADRFQRHHERLTYDLSAQDVRHHKQMEVSTDEFGQVPGRLPPLPSCSNVQYLADL
jgi:chromosome segregation ATPase